MQPHSRPHQPRRPILRRGGFTLAEVAVTIAIIGIALTLVVEGLNKAKFESAHTRNLKVARELALATLGELAGGVYSSELETDDELEGTYADQGYPLFEYEVLIGDQQFTDRSDEDEDRYGLPYDTVRARREREEELEADRGEEDEEEVEEPYEVVKIRVRFPSFVTDGSTGEFSELILEQWMEWSLVHGETEEGAAAGGAPGEVNSESSGSGAPR
jgi:prepilin-type N-terminal cleavage/methylation domain-containing protein